MEEEQRTSRFIDIDLTIAHLQGQTNPFSQSKTLLVVTRLPVACDQPGVKEPKWSMANMRLVCFWWSCSPALAGCLPAMESQGK